VSNLSLSFLSVSRKTSPLIEKFYKELREKTKELPFEEADQFLETVNLLCSEYECEAYVEGVKIGIRLMCELMA
jgi:hypothetical protein